MLSGETAIDPRPRGRGILAVVLAQNASALAGLSKGAPLGVKANQSPAAGIRTAERRGVSKLPRKSPGRMGNTRHLVLD